MKNQLPIWHFCIVALFAGAVFNTLAAQSTFPASGITLPSGKSVVITYDVDVNANACTPNTLPVANLSNQSNVSGSNFATVQTDDPDIAGASNATLTPFAGIPVGNLVYTDVNRNGVFDAGDTGINGVLLNIYLDVNGNNALDAGDGAPLGTATTATVSMQAGVYNFDVCPGTYIIQVDPSNFAMGGALFNSGQPLVSSPTTAAPDPDFSTTDNDDNGNTVSGFGVASAAFTVSAAINHVDFGFKTPTAVTITDFALNEGNGGGTIAFNFLINRSDTDDAFSLTVNTADGTALSPADYTAISGGTVNFFAGGSSSTSVTVFVNRDNIVEAAETFTVNLSGAPAGIYITDAQAVGTINNDDNATVTLSAPTPQNEGNAGTTAFTFTATLNNPVQGGFTVPYTTNVGSASAGIDYTDNDGTLIFVGTAGETQTWTVNVNGDVTVELDETFQGALGAIAGAPSGVTTAGSPQTATITNDDAATVSIAADVSQSEAITPMPFTINLSNPVDVSVTVVFGSSSITATGGVDFTSLTGASVIFPAGTTTSQTLNATIVPDAIVENDEVFNVSIGTAFASGRNVTTSLASRNGTIVNDDVTTVVLTGGSAANEGNTGTTSRTFTATLSNAVQGGFTLPFTTNDGTATTASADYVDNDGSLTFAGTAGESQTISVLVNGDLIVEADETFTVALGAASAGSAIQSAAISTAGSPQTGTIQNDEQDWGDAPTAAQSGFAASYPTTLANNGARHSAALGDLRLGATIEGNTDGVPNATATGDTDEDGVTLPSNFILNLPANITVNASATGKLDAWFDWNRDGDWSDPGEQVFTNQSVVAGNNTLSVTTPAGASVGASFARFRLSSVGGLAVTGAAADGEVEDYQVNIQNVSLSVNDVTLTETNSGTTNAVFTVSLNNPAPAGGVTFDIATADNTATTANNDYVAQSLTGQSIPAGMSSYSFTVVVNGDNIVENNETFFVNVTNVVGAGVSDAQGLGTITNDDAATVTLSGGIAQNEGNAGTVAYSFTATLNNPVQGGFSVPYTTGGGTATAGTDYTDNDGTLSFAGTAGETKTWTVNVNGDVTVELDETFDAALGAIAGAPAGVTTAGTPQTATITNDDQAVASFTTTFSANEGNSGTQSYTLTFNLSNPVDVPVEFGFTHSDGTATNADNDYINAGGAFTVPVGASGSINAGAVQVIIGDTKVEANEVFNVILAANNFSGRNVVFAGGGSSITNTITIVNDDAATVTLTGGTAQNEGNAGTTGFIFTATLNNAVQGGFTMPYTTGGGTATAGTDYTDNDGTLNFTGTAGETKTWTVNVNGDLTVELNETFEGALGAITGAPAGVTTAGTPQTSTITNDDAATINISANVSQLENITPQSFSVTLSNPVDVPVTVDFSTTAGTATAGTDYTSITNQTVTFPAGSNTSQTVNVVIVNENVVEADETYTVAVANLQASGRNAALGANASRTGTILNDDAATVTLTGGIAQNEGNAGTVAYTFTATLNNPVQGGFTVPYTTGGGTATAGTDYTDNDGTLSFAGTAGETQTWTVNVNGDVTVELNETFEGALGALIGAPTGVTTAGSPQTATINNDDSAVISIAGNVSQPEATTPQVFTVTLSNPVDVNVTVQFSTSDGTATTGNNDYTGIAGQTVTFNAGTTTAQTVPVSIVNDNIVETNEVYNTAIGTLNNSGRNVTLGITTATGTITNDDNSILTLAGGATVSEGNSGFTNVPVTITSSNPVQGGFTVAFALNDGTATVANNDYVDLDATVSFNGTQNEVVPINAQVAGDLIIENNENFTVTISGVNAPLPGTITIAGSPQTITIVNDELDWGDAPTAAQSGFAGTYPTLLADNGARHAQAPGGLRLGATLDADLGGQPNATASGDGADEDGVTLPTSLVINTTANITVNASGAGVLNAWADFNRDGDWNDAGEKIYSDVAVVSGNNNLSFAVPNASLGNTFLRFRLSTAAGTAVNGLAADGEVEDYIINVVDNQFSINDVSISEGNSGATNLDFEISRTSNATASSVNYAITGGTATSGSDYTPLASGTINFPLGGALSQTLTVAVLGDLVIEDNETVIITLSNPVNGAISDNSGTGTINNDDSGTLTLSGGIAQNEGNSLTTAYTFTATLSAAVQGGFSVAYTTNNGTATTADNDYQDNDGNLTFTGTAGETQTFTVLVNGDNKVEFDETFTGALGLISGTTTTQNAAITLAGTPQTSTITNDDAAIVAIAGNVSASEATTPQNFSVTLSNPVDVNVTVLFNTSDGTATTADNDYTGISNQTVTFLAGTTTAQTVPVAITNDNKVEADEVYNVAIGTLNAAGRNVTLGTAAATGTITNNDNATVTLSGNVVHPEGNTGLTDYVFTVTLNNPVQGGFTVNYNTNNSSASFGSDYIDNDGDLTFVGTANEVQTIIVQGIGDFIVENNESFRINLNSINGAPIAGAISFGNAQAFGDLLNDEVDYGDAPDTYSTLLASNGARHNAFPTLFLGNATDGDADGQPTATANGDDTDAEGDDDDGVTLPNPLITNVTANVVVRASASGFLDGWVDYDNNGDFSGAGEKVFNSVAVVAGNNNLSFLVPNGATPALTFARFRLSATGGLSFNGLANSGEVEDYQVQIVNTQFSISDPVVTEGNAGTSNLAFVISRSNAASDCSVNYTITGGTALSGSDYQVLAAGTASFTANGALMQTINVLVNGDVTVELNETVEMTLSAPVNGTILDGTGIGTITNDDAAVLSVNSPTVTEGGPINTVTLTFNLTLSNPSDANVVVNYATVDGSATIANSDYQSAAGTHTFAPGETSKQVVVTINGDCVIEPNESFILRLSNLQNNGRSITLSGGGATTDGTGTITNDDFPPTFTVTGGGVRCDTDTQGLPVGLSGSQTGVNYQLQLNGNNVGAPVAGTGNPISFGEQLAVGTYTVVATIVATGCTQTMLGSVTVSTISCGVSISDPCVCLNNATTLENGQFGEQIKVNAPSSQTWTVTAINGLFTTTSAAPPSAPTPITVGTVLANIGGNMFTLDGRHIDAIGYTVTVSNGRGTSLSIGNSCAYPNPAITSDLTGPFCLYSDPVTLTGTPGDANFVSATFTVNGVPATTFDPGAGLGQYTIVYRVDGGVPKAAGANDPGCVQTVSQIVNVVATPSALSCNDFVNISLDVDCVTEITPDMILEGTYGCFDDYIVELDKTAPFGNGPWVPAVVGTADLGKTYQARVTHLVSGNKCWGEVKIEDKLAPVLSCQNVDLFCPITNYTPSYITNTLGIAAGTPTVTDCSNYTLTHVDTWVDLACGQTFNGQQNLSAYVERKWTAQDQFGNSSTCLQYIYFRRISLTQITLPADAEVDCTNPNTSPANTGAPSVTALGQTWTLWPNVGYCELNVTYTDQPLPVCDGTYKILRTWLIYDWCQPTNPGTNPITHIQVIKVLDQSGPVIACP
ncbi:MAG: hypothetical protein J0L99_18540, partial [Chitinophagales bacterium]|nr:hypothetical protein [Chitinophagales bacterium]